ncbi:MAG: polysaccharide deacetylase family protein [Halobacteriaceae archaeon]
MAATVTISIEVELAWGHHDISGGLHPALSESREAETKFLNHLLTLCDNHKLPLTFDIVGHLFHESCQGDHNGPHQKRWFDIDPGTDIKKNPHFYAPDLVEIICSSAENHEIGTHTYSHIICDEVQPNVVDWELQKVRECHSSFGIDTPVSIVPPRHKAPPTNVLHDRGIQVVRTVLPDYSFPESGLGTIIHMIARSHPSGGRRIVLPLHL